MALPRIGIVLLDEERRTALRARVEARGLSVKHCSGLTWDRAVRMAGTDVDAWLIEDSHLQIAPSLPAGQQILMINIEAESFIGSLSWHQVVDRKLEELVRKYQKIYQASRARNVWLLAASAGGLHAVRAFLEGLEAFYGVAFVYAQHIEAEQANQLVKMIARNTPWHAQMALDGNLLTTGSVTVVCPAQRVALSNGLVLNCGSSWSGPYAPNIDEVAAELANEYGPACGMIVFSGMGDDGVAGSRLICEKGGSVLVQSPADCTVSALSEAVIKDGAFNQSGNIHQLREAFIKLLSASPANPSVMPRGVLRGRE
ncbi:MAG: chemotaxis protein CheB [Candidatus Reddybacter sp.]